ncbi:hypothetical protein Kkor_1148 [Kangiella koreensis DSM 16069]|uniref:Uncharacterized protein n=1 Tax=Kangiella koreensis (strain DSM 16069 / JCM 12317 / KCTC 12182 / SW-125) TaxID=523791 RepID=C7RBC5_KANKD|nr:hypothetical protein Kkor_1148 [Kangiella koreensis DSM 16069]
MKDLGGHIGPPLPSKSQEQILNQVQDDKPVELGTIPYACHTAARPRYPVPLSFGGPWPAPT